MYTIVTLTLTHAADGHALTWRKARLGWKFWQKIIYFYVNNLWSFLLQLSFIILSCFRIAEAYIDVIFPQKLSFSMTSRLNWVHLVKSKFWR